MTSTRLGLIARRAPATALCFGAITFLSGLGKFWPTPGWLDTRYAAVVLFAPIIVSLALIGIFLRLFWQAGRRPPPGFQLSRYRGKPAYLAPRNPLLRGSIFIVQMMIAPGLLFTERAPNATMRLYADFRWASYLALPVFLTVSIWAFFQRSGLTLTPDGLILHTPIRTTRIIGWHALAPGGVMAAPQQRVVWLLVDPTVPETAEDTRHGLHPAPPGYRWIPIETSGLSADPTYLVQALRYYLHNPTARSGIGWL